MVFIAVGLLAVTRYTSGDPDSTVYAGIAARLSMLPLRQWMAPEWWGLWGNQGPFREHPIGIFVLPALLARAGYPAGQAAYAIGVLYAVASVLLLRKVAAFVVRPHEAVAVQWAALLLPIAFVYRIRANQEYPVLMLLLVCVYATERSRRRAGWIAVSVAGALALMLVKGIFVVYAPIVCGLWLLLVRHDDSRDAGAWAGIAGMVAAIALGAIGYEALYRGTTGDSFLSFYLFQRLYPNAGAGRHDSPYRKLYNVLWYSARVLWFGAPGSVVLLSAGRFRSGMRSLERQAAIFCVAVAVVYVLLMSLGGNKADRFIFPAYFSVGAAGAALAMRRWEGVDRIARRVTALEPYGTAVFWLALFLLTLVTAQSLPRIKFWSS